MHIKNHLPCGCTLYVILFYLYKSCNVCACPYIQRGVFGGEGWGEGPSCHTHHTLLSRCYYSAILLKRSQGPEAETKGRGLTCFTVVTLGSVDSELVMPYKCSVLHR